MSDGFPQPTDGRNLAGAYGDNRVIPCSVVQVSVFSDASKKLLLRLIESVIDFLPEGSLTARMDDVRAHLDDTWFKWMGKYTESDPFQFRINNPVLICEFDNECGMYLSNSEPERFHVYTVVRTPHGNNYGKSYPGNGRRITSLDHSTLLRAG